MKLSYMCHPVAGDIPGNLARARLWLKWVVENSLEPIAVIAPWISDVEIWDDDKPMDREAGLARCRAVIERCDEVILVGGRVSSGMDMERRHAMKHAITVVDMTAMGALPPAYT